MNSRHKWVWLWFLVPVIYFLIGLWSDWYLATRR
jgi:hypothetical protein